MQSINTTKFRSILADLTVSKRPGTRYQIEIHFAGVFLSLTSFIFFYETC